MRLPNLFKSNFCLLCIYILSWIHWAISIRWFKLIALNCSLHLYIQYSYHQVKNTIQYLTCKLKIEIQWLLMRFKNTFLQTFRMPSHIIPLSIYHLNMILSLYIHYNLQKGNTFYCYPVILETLGSPSPCRVIILAGVWVQGNSSALIRMIRLRNDKNNTLWTMQTPKS